MTNLMKWWCVPGVEKRQGDGDQNGGMDDVDGVGAAVEPVPDGGGLVHAGSEEQEPKADETPGYEGFPEGVEDGRPR